MPQKYIALDFETANGTPTSACALAYCVIENYKIVKTRDFIINPEAGFNYGNISIHGITAADVFDAPTFPEVWAEIKDDFAGNVVLIAHNATFDMSVLINMQARYNIPIIKCKYLCTYLTSAAILPLENHRLNTVAEFLNVSLEHHHNAACDALACAEIFIEMAQSYGIDVFSARDTALVRITETHNVGKIAEYANVELYYTPITRADLAGKHICITGDVPSLSRKEILAFAESCGAVVQGGVTKRTELLFVGLENKNVVTDSECAKSGKILKAESINANGGSIIFVSCDNIKEMMKCATVNS